MKKLTMQFIAPQEVIINSFTAIKRFALDKIPVKAKLHITALGMYEAN